jgi:hypothetical protein
MSDYNRWITIDPFYIGISQSCKILQKLFSNIDWNNRDFIINFATKTKKFNIIVIDKATIHHINDDGLNFIIQYLLNDEGIFYIPIQFIERKVYYTNGKFKSLKLFNGKITYEKNIRTVNNIVLLDIVNLNIPFPNIDGEESSNLTQYINTIYCKYKKTTKINNIIIFFNIAYDNLNTNEITFETLEIIRNLIPAENI